MRGGGVRRLMAKVMKNDYFFWNTSLSWIAQRYFQTEKLPNKLKSDVKRTLDGIFTHRFKRFETNFLWCRWHQLLDYISVEKSIMLLRVVWGEGICVQNFAKLAHTHFEQYMQPWLGLDHTNDKQRYNHAKDIQFFWFCLIKYWTIAPPVWEPLYTWWWSQMEEGWVGLL